jgi:hypothetical protein
VLNSLVLIYNPCRPLAFKFLEWYSKDFPLFFCFVLFEIQIVGYIYKFVGAGSMMLRSYIEIHM